MTANDEYLELVPKVLMKFQWIEESIRFYIVRTELTIKSHVEKVFRYSTPTLRKLERMSLGQLVDYFACQNGNDALIKRLRDIVEHRNHVAHGGYLLYVDDAGKIPDIEDRLVRLKAVYSEACDLVPILMSEAQAISVRLGASLHGHPVPSSPREERT
jgi:hypothetical protein